MPARNEFKPAPEVEYYLLNKQVDPIAGQIPFKVEMTDLYNTLKASRPRYD